MQRLIKFRAWGRKLVDDEPTLSEPFELTEICKECGTFNGATGVDMYSDYILMQYTGLKDRHGVEIYEGDIVTSIISDVNVVTFGEQEDRERYATYWGFNLWPDWEYKVIGNIWENPELLK